MASKIVQPSGKIRRQAHQKSRRESSSSTASSCASRNDPLFLKVSPSTTVMKNAASDDRLRRFLRHSVRYPHYCEMPVFEEKTERRRRSLGDMKRILAEKQQRHPRSISCMELYWKMPDFSTNNNASCPKIEEQEKLRCVPSSNNERNFQATFHNPFPIRKRTSLIERVYNYCCANTISVVISSQIATGYIKFTGPVFSVGFERITNKKAMPACQSCEATKKQQISTALIGQNCDTTSPVVTGDHLDHSGDHVIKKTLLQFLLIERSFYRSLRQNFEESPIVNEQLAKQKGNYDASGLQVRTNAMLGRTPEWDRTSRSLY
uniref:Uncharacterized protein n=1 Tax=Romanomermis culicivorax TaxID=13658 RepID=A0A915IPG9_ROMCU